MALCTMADMEWRPNLLHCAKFRQQFAILYLWGTLWNDPQRVIGGLYHCVKFGPNRYNSSDNTKFEYFMHLA